MESYKQGYVERKNDTNEFVKKFYRTYTCSFSTEQDSLSMWTYYAASGNGVNITFDFAWNLFDVSNDSNAISSKRLTSDINICRGIILYPYIKEQESLFELGIKELLWEKGISNVPIFHSAIPMRKYF